jgi:hypothetical protein
LGAIDPEDRATRVASMPGVKKREQGVKKWKGVRVEELVR